ncbi:MAG: SpoIIE family protein phosphatase, partial [Bacteroidales bacterium]|nr:SpoIIE family protein phosphatase [Bacteroidales bacterium]
MKKLSLTISLILLIVSSSSSFGQEYFFRQYSIEQGLPQSSIFCAVEDQRGEMWIGTEGSGICRFNGIDFQVMDKSNGLSGNIVRSVFEDSKGNIWIGTENGLNKYNGYKLQSFAENGITETVVLAINEDSDGKIWIGTESKGLFTIEEKDSVTVKNYSIEDGLTNVFIFDIDFDSLGRAWLSLIGGINVIEDDGEELKVTKLIEGYDIPSGYISCGNMDSDGNMWFGSLDQGVFKIEVSDDLESINVLNPNFLNMLGTERIWDIHWTAENECFVATEDMGVVQFNHEKVLNHFTKESGLKTDQVYRITESENGEMWFSTLGNGILKFENKLLISYHEGIGIHGTKIYDVKANDKGELLVASDEGLSIYNFNGETPVEVKTYSTVNGLKSNDVTTISTDNHEIWLGGSHGVAKIVNGKVQYPDMINKGLIGDKVSCLLHDSHGNIWIGTEEGYNLYMDGDLYRINEDQGFINNEVQTIIEDHEGNFWIGTLGGLVRMKGQEYTDFNKEDGLTELGIHSLAEDKYGNIWIGTFGGGIFLFNKEYDSIPISNVADKQILSSNNIYALAFLSDTILIAATESGFDQISIGSDNSIKQSIHFDVNDGYLGGGNNLNAIHVDKNSIVWLGNAEGLVRFDQTYQAKLLSPPSIQISNIKLKFSDQDWSERGDVQAWFNLPQKLVLSHKENNVTIEYASVFFGNHNDLSYSYILEGRQKQEWSPYGKERYFRNTSLSPGKYYFKVRVKNKYGRVSEPAVFSWLTVKPPFWQTPWFVIMVVLLIFASVIIFIRWRINKLKREKEELEEIVVERTSEVVEQKEHIERQHDIVKTQNIEIEASIQYAEKIQKAVVPTRDILTKQFEDSMVLWRPQHIVSGDFYWIGKKDGKLIFTAADCTGHGVPGAFMSMLGISALNQIVNEEATTDPGQILTKLRMHIINSFRQHEQDLDDRKDGMDICICSFDTKSKKLYYAGAYNPLFLLKDRGEEEPECIEYPADRMPVGLYAKMDDFATNEVDFSPGDAV